MTKTSDIIVELHEIFETGVSGVLRKRFQDTHTINSVKLKGVDYGEYDALKEMPLSDILVMVESDRAELQQWYFMEPRNSTPDSHGSTV